MSDDNFAPKRVFSSNNACFRDGGMFTQGRLDLLRGDVAAAPDDNFLFSSGEPIETVGIARCKIAGTNPTVLKYCARRLWFLPITRRQMRAANINFTHTPSTSFRTLCIRKTEINAFAGLPNRANANLTRSVPTHGRDFSRAAVNFPNGCD